MYVDDWLSGADDEVEGCDMMVEAEDVMKQAGMLLTKWGCNSDTVSHDDVINGNIFRVTGHLYGEFTGPRWIPHTKASDAGLWCFLWSASE